ncbi:MAG: tetratricopeptide repeat protein [Bradymonadia bacterium]
MKYPALISILVLLGVPPVSAAPDDVERVQRLGDEAEKAHRHGRFEDAVELYKDAYAISQSPPEILYNIGVIYEKELRDFDMAIAFFERFLDAPNVDAIVASKAQSRLRRLKEIHRDIPLQEVGREPTTSVGAWWLFGLGGLTTAVGLTFGGVALHNSRVFEDSRNLDEKRDIKSLAETQALTADILIGTGASICIGSLIWLFVDGRSVHARREQSSGHLYLSPGGFGWSLTW